MNQQDHVYIIQNANRSTLALPNPAQGANELAKPRLTSKHATSWALAKNLAEGAINQQDHVLQMCKSRTFKLLPRPCTGPRINKTTFTSFKHANTWDPCQNLAEGAISQQDHVYTLKSANQEHSSSCQILHRQRMSQQDHVFINQNANQELSSSCQNLTPGTKSQQNHVYNIQTCK